MIDASESAGVSSRGVGLRGFESHPPHQRNGMTRPCNQRLSLKVFAKRIVRSGYNKIAARYTEKRTVDSEDIHLLKLLVARLPKQGLVLDAGCGSGHPVTQFLAKHFQVTGVDFANEQVQLARIGLPDSGFVCADIANMPFKENVFDALCPYYAIIHLPHRTFEIANWFS